MYRSSFITCSGIMSFRGASPLGLPDTRPRAPLRRHAPCAWLARCARSLRCISWDRHRREKVLEDGVGVHVLGLRAHRPGDAMTRRVAEDLLDVVLQRPGAP